MILLRTLTKPLINTIKNISLTPSLNSSIKYSFAFMALFQNHKKHQQLSPVFKRQTKLKGHLKSKARRGVVSVKLNESVRQPLLKAKNHRGMLKRIKIVGPRWNRQFKFQSPDNYHLKRNKTRSNLKRKGKARYIHQSDIWRVRRIIPYFKRKSLKMRF